MRLFSGIGASEGFAVGVVRRLHHIQTATGRQVRSPSQEKLLYEQAVQTAKQQLEELEQRASANEKAIFAAQAMMLEDGGLTDEIFAYMQAGAGAAAAVERAAGIYAGKLRALDDEYLRERACDVLDACYRLVHILDGAPQGVFFLSAPVIIATDELYPSDLLMMERAKILGIITSRGSANAHASILARMMGVPAVVMAGEELLEQCDGVLAAIDGWTGEVYLEPDNATCARMTHSMRKMHRQRESLREQQISRMPCMTGDGVPVALRATGTGLEDVSMAMDAGAQGMGILFSEYGLPLAAVNDEDVQYRFYRSCLEKADGQPVTISTYDFGGDKTPPGLEAAKEDNPAMGLCGIRHSLANPTLFLKQVCAMMRAAAYGNLRMALPMVNSRAEVQQVLDYVRDARRILHARGQTFADCFEVGVLLETPAAVLSARELAKDTAFFCLRPEKVMQYAFAADQENNLVAAYFPPYDSGVVNAFIGTAVHTAKETARPLCVCCEGADPAAQAEMYVRMGVRELSVPIYALSAVKERLLTTHVQQPDKARETVIPAPRYEK